jgi:hypothetical protein
MSLGALLDKFAEHTRMNVTTETEVNEFILHVGPGRIRDYITNEYLKLDDAHELETDLVGVIHNPFKQWRITQHCVGYAEPCTELLEEFVDRVILQYGREPILGRPITINNSNDPTDSMALINGTMTVYMRRAHISALPY